MSMALAQWLVLAGVSYCVVGLLFALVFVNVGAARIDPAARGMPVPVRLLLVPGTMVLWPLMLFKWVARRSPPDA